MNPTDQAGSLPVDDARVRHPLDWLERTGTSDALLHELQLRRQRRGRRRRIVAGLGGMAALLMIAGLLWPRAEGGFGGSEMPASSTIVSVPYRRVLPDGSVVELRDGAEIVVDYSRRMRRVALKQGEAHFQVAKNDAIPFIVAVAGVEIRAVGTAFSVHAVAAAIEVLVTEGRVAVEQGAGGREHGAAVEQGAESMAQGPRITGYGPRTTDNGPAGNRPATIGVQPLTPSLPRPLAPLYISAGNRVVLDAVRPPGAPANPQVMPVSPAEIGERLAWRVPRIEFSGTRLAEAIPVFNRHSRVRVVLGDPALERLQLSGILRADNVDALVRLLEANYHVTAERREDEVVLRRSNPARAVPPAAK